MSAVSKYLPRKVLSFVVGKIMHWRGPKPIVEIMIKTFAFMYKINLSEAELPITSYPSVGDFFVRKLRPGLRPISSSLCIHPCDSQIVQYGPIVDSQLIQAKGISYKLVKFTEDPQCHVKYGNGYFITYYLCPTDYHRVHSPVSGFVTHIAHYRGDLWPVNHWALKTIGNLYSTNERVLVEIATEHGPVSVVFVGALNVGNITINMDSSIRGNHKGNSQRKKLPEPIEVKMGDELGMFRMGSTVVVLYSEEFRTQFKKDLKLAEFVKVGQPVF